MEDLGPCISCQWTITSKLVLISEMFSVTYWTVGLHGRYSPSDSSHLGIESVLDQIKSNSRQMLDWTGRTGFMNLVYPWKKYRLAISQLILPSHSLVVLWILQIWYKKTIFRAISFFLCWQVLFPFVSLPAWHSDIQVSFHIFLKNYAPSQKQFCGIKASSSGNNCKCDCLL